MHTPFDDIAKSAFTATLDVMGERDGATWLMSSGGEMQGRILFRNPSEPVQIGQTDTYELRPCAATAEYYEGTFPGLKQICDKQSCFEKLVVRGDTYLIREVVTKYDGKTYVAHLDPCI